MSSVPVGTVNTVPSASFFNVMSDVEPCPVRISPSAAVYPIAALSPAAVSVVASTVPPVMTPVVVIAPAPTSILVNPDVIEPESNAPTDTRPVAVVIEFCVAVATVPVKLPTKQLM